MVCVAALRAMMMVRVNGRTRIGWGGIEGNMAPASHHPVYLHPSKSGECRVFSRGVEISRVT